MSEARSIEELKELIRQHGPDLTVESLIKQLIPLTRKSWTGLNWAGTGHDEGTAPAEWMVEIPEYLTETPMDPSLYTEVWGLDASSIRPRSRVPPEAMEIIYREIESHREEILGPERSNSTTGPTKKGYRH